MKNTLLLILAVFLLFSCGNAQTQPAPSPDTVREGWTCLSSDDRVYGGSYRNFSDGIQSVGDYLYFDGGNGGYSFPVNGHDNCSLLRIDCETGETEIVVVREGTK